MVNEIHSLHAEATRELLEKHPHLRLEHINDGYCNQWAAVFWRLLRSRGYEPRVEQTEHQEHYWVELCGRYYDSDRPQGVDDWRRLPTNIDLTFFCEMKSIPTSESMEILEVV